MQYALLTADGDDRMGTSFRYRSTHFRLGLGPRKIGSSVREVNLGISFPPRLTCLWKLNYPRDWRLLLLL